LVTRTATVEFENGKVSVEQMVQALRKAGFDARPVAAR
jgi:copper chaperone CopZ